jgi:hypothetical protein
MRFSRGELAGVDVLTPLADRLPGRDRLAAGAFGECLGPGRYEDLVRCPQLVDRLLGRRLLDERSGRGELSRVQMQADPLSQRDRQRTESADIAGKLEIPRGELVPAVVIPPVVGAVTGLSLTPPR